MMMINDIKKILTQELYKSYEIDQDEGVIIIKTPLRYDDGDYAVVFITPQSDQEFIIDDNGEAATRLMFEGVDIESQLIQTWLKNTQAIYHIEWDAKHDKLWCKSHLHDLVEKVIGMAQSSVQMQTLTAVVLKSEEEQEIMEGLLSFLLSLYQQKGNHFSFPSSSWELLPQYSAQPEQ